MNFISQSKYNVQYRNNHAIYSYTLENRGNLDDPALFGQV